MIKYIEYYKTSTGELRRKVYYDNGFIVDESGYAERSVEAYEYPRYDQNKPEEYVTGLLWDGKGSVGVLRREQNGFTYTPDGKKIVGKGKHVAGSTGAENIKEVK